MTAKAVRIKIKVGQHPAAAAGVDYTPPRIPWRRAEITRQRIYVAVGVTAILAAVLVWFALRTNDDAGPPADFADSELSSPKSASPHEISPSMPTNIPSPVPPASNAATPQEKTPTHATTALKSTAEADTANTTTNNPAITPNVNATKNTGAASVTPSGSPSVQTTPANRPIKNGIDEQIFSPHLTRTQLATKRIGLEPSNRVDDRVKAASRGTVRVYYFNELSGLKGKTITHQWTHNGRIYANVSSEIKNNTWRMYSSKVLNSTMIGGWKITVTDESGNTLATRSFSYEK